MPAQRTLAVSRHDAPSPVWDFGGALLVAAAWLAALSGCAGRAQAQIAPISGMVTYQGKPLPHGQIVFVHASGKMGIAEIQPDGSYLAEAPLGECQVMVTCYDQPDLSKLNPRSGLPLDVPHSLIPARYSNYQTSGFMVTIVDGENKSDWALED